MADIYIDYLPVDYGFADVVSDKIQSSKGYGNIFFSWLNSELDIIAGDVINITETSVTLRAFVPSLGNFATALVWFEYWEEDNPSNGQATNFVSVNNIGWVYQDISGLLPVTNYRYKVYIQGDTINLVESYEIPFSTAGTWNIDLLENLNFVENNCNRFEINYVESGNFYELFKLWDIYSIKEYENLSLEEKQEKYFSFEYKEQLQTEDKYFIIFDSEYEEKMIADENKFYGKEQPDKWLIVKPLNENWHFSEDTDSDGIANGWNYENVDIENCNISWYFTKPTVQKIKFLESGRFWTELKAEGRFALYMEFSCNGDLGFKIYDKDSGDIYYQKRYIERNFGIEKLRFDTNCNLVFEFFGSNIEFYIDNFVVVSKELENKFHKHNLTGLSVFSYNIKGNNLKSGLKRYYEETNIISKDFNLEFNVITRKQLEYLKFLKNKTIYVYTPLRESFAFYVEGFKIIDSDVMDRQEWNQKYKVSMLVREV